MPDVAEDWQFHDAVNERLAAGYGLPEDRPTFVPDVARAVVAALTADHDPDQVVGGLSVGALPTLLEASAAESDEEDRSLLDEVIDRLLAGERDEAYEAVRRWAGADDARVRATGHLGLGRFRDADDDSWLAGMWRDEDEELVERGLADPDPTVRAAAEIAYAGEPD
ncbi:hypothetical protein AB0K04_07655 [Micromonospora coxensis]|uniref:hypothetical protein n=1 Tax=Micromonospora coxensis TaxID=356852 RepID=UPI003434491D